MIVSNNINMTTANALTRVQVYKHMTRDRVLDISEMLSLEPRRSKIAFTLVEFDESHKATVRVKHYADATDFKLVCWDILSGSFDEWTDYKGTVYDDGIQARTLSLRRDTKYRQPFVLKIDNGHGEVLAGGAVKMVEVRDSLTLLLSDFEARKLAQSVLDYIRDWETVNFRRRQEAMTVVLPVAELAQPSLPILESEGEQESAANEESTTPRSRRRSAKAA
jgi:hypothetical protein